MLWGRQTREDGTSFLSLSVRLILLVTSPLLSLGISGSAASRYNLIRHSLCACSKTVSKSATDEFKLEETLTKTLSLFIFPILPTRRLALGHTIPRA